MYSTQDSKELASSHLEYSDPEAATLTTDAVAQQSKNVCRKFDRRLLPLLFCLYLVSYLDRGNIGNAKTAGTQEDLGLSDMQWTWVLYAFYIVYTLFEWSILLWKVFPAHIYVCILCTGWSTAAMCSGAVTSYSGLLACRAFLGLFEAAFGAGAVYFLSLFYTRRELGTRLSLVLGTSPLANCFASALAYGVTQIKGSIEPWRLLFIIEGAPAILLIPIVYFLLPDSPSKARYLTETELHVASERMPTIDRTEKSKIAWTQITAGLSDPKNWAHAAMHFCCNYSFAGLSNFLPTIVEEMGFSSVNAQGVTAPIYFAAFILSVLSAYVSDRVGQRGWFVTAFATMGCAGYLMLALIHDVQSVGPRYAAVWLTCCGIFPALALNVTWLFSNQGGDTKKGAGFAILTTIGQCSSFASSALFPSKDEPIFVTGSAVGCGLTGLIVIISVVLHFALVRENKKRDEQYGPVDPDARVDVTDGGDNRRFFRYLI